MAVKKYSSNEIRVGLFVLIPVLMMLVVIIFKLGYSVNTATVDVYLKVDSIKSIKKGTLVKVKGYEIGRVVEMIPVYEPELHFLAVMRIKRGVDLYENCTAVIQNQNIIGDSVIEVVNPERKIAKVQHGDVIEGIEYVSLDKVLQNVNMLLTSFTGTANTVSRVVADSSGGLRELMDKLGTSVNSINALLQGSQQDILAMIESFRKTAKTMEEISVELKKHPVKFLMK